MTAAVVIAALFVGLVVREVRYQRRLRRMEDQLWENCDWQGLWPELNASRDRGDRVPDERGAS